MEDLTPSATNLSTPYTAKAVFYEASDIVEYVRADVATVSRRVDSFLTLAYDMKHTDQLVGFKLKGFKNFYLKRLKDKQQFDDFVAVVSVLEKAIGSVGDSLFGQQDRQEAYRKAREIAASDDVRVPVSEMRHAG
jgi:hypothetical protein